MNRKNLPLLLMLVAGAVTCIINLIQNVTILGQLTSLLIVLVIFYFLGSVLKWTLDYFDNENEKAKKAEEGEGEVVEKESEDKAGEESKAEK